MKCMTICGTRPEVVRLSEIIKKLDQCVDHILVHTGQSYDYEMSQIFFDELKIRKPDYQLGVKSATVGEQLGKILTQTEVVMLKEKPDAVLILGDTNSALSCIMAKRLKIPIFHMEAGNRAFDDRVPEEINRRIVDVTSDINLCYTEHARRNLLAMGLPTRNIFVTGSPLPEVYYNHYGDIQNAHILSELKLIPNGYFLTSCHRDETISNPEKLRSIFRAFSALVEGYNIPMIFFAHPRTAKVMEGFRHEISDRIAIRKPIGMFDFISLEQNAFVTITDSGTASEDGAIFQIPIVIPRDSIERPESQDCGNVIQVGVDPKSILEVVKLARMQVDNKIVFSNPYGNDHNVSDKIARLIVGMHKIVKERAYHA